MSLEPRVEALGTQIRWVLRSSPLDHAWRSWDGNVSSHTSAPPGLLARLVRCATIHLREPRTRIQRSNRACCVLRHAIGVASEIGHLAGPYMHDVPLLFTLQHAGELTRNINGQLGIAKGDPGTQSTIVFQNKVILKFTNPRVARNSCRSSAPKTAKFAFQNQVASK